MGIFKKIALVGLLVLCGCAVHPEVPEVWVRTDGLGILDSPARKQQADIDQIVCAGEVQKANLSGTQVCRGVAGCVLQAAMRDGALGTVARGCMAQKGYVMIPADQVVAYSLQARTNAVQGKSASAR